MYSEYASESVILEWLKGFSYKKLMLKHEKKWFQNMKKSDFKTWKKVISKHEKSKILIFKKWGSKHEKNIFLKHEKNRLFKKRVFSCFEHLKPLKIGRFIPFWVPRLENRRADRPSQRPAPNSTKLLEKAVIKIIP